MDEIKPQVEKAIRDALEQQGQFTTEQRAALVLAITAGIEAFRAGVVARTQTFGKSDESPR